MNEDFIAVTGCTITKRTKNAILVFHEDSNEEHWIPLSTVNEEDSDEDDEMLAIEEWKVRELGWV